MGLIICKCGKQISDKAIICPHCGVKCDSCSRITEFKVINNETYDKDKLTKAKLYINSLAQGINPFNGEDIIDDSILNNGKVVRCFIYIADLLDSLIKGKSPNNIHKSAEIIWNDSIKNKMVLSEMPLTISEIARNINSIFIEEGYKKLSYKYIQQWLFEQELLFIDGTSNRKKPTEKGKEKGIYEELRTGSYGTYNVILYNNNAQVYILDNMNSILDCMKDFLQDKKNTFINSHSKWTTEEEQKLLESYNNGITIKELSLEHKRPESAIKRRLRRKGINVE